MRDHRVMRRFARHRDSGEPLPAELLDAFLRAQQQFPALELQELVRERSGGSGARARRNLPPNLCAAVALGWVTQVCLSMFDLIVFGGEELRQGRSNVQVRMRVAQRADCVCVPRAACLVQPRLRGLCWRDQIWNDVFRTHFSIPALPGTHWFTTFSHLNSYAAGYYSYLCVCCCCCGCCPAGTERWFALYVLYRALR